MIDNGFGGFDLKKTVVELEKRVQELEDKLFPKEDPAEEEHHE